MSADAGPLAGGPAAVPGLTMLGESGVVCDGDVCWVPQGPHDQVADAHADDEGTPVHARDQ